jgi:hypothetical protein
MAEILRNLKDDAVASSVSDILSYQLAYARPWVKSGSGDPYWENAERVGKEHAAERFQGLSQDQVTAIILFLDAIEPHIRSWDRDVHAFACSFWTRSGKSPGE